MAYEYPPNRGSLFKNKERNTDTAPEYSGEINIDGVLYFLDAWVNESMSGKYFKLRTKRKDKQPEQSTNHLSTNYDDSIPI
jgi:hypothetical protein